MSAQRDKTTQRLRRARRTRSKVAKDMPRLTVHRTPMHIRAQIVLAGRVLAQASTLEKALELKGHSGNIVSAGQVGALLAERAKAAKVLKVAFDRSGYKYHGRVKALADAARQGGIEF